MPSPADPAKFVAEFDAGEPSPEALHWVQRAFRAHLAGESLTRAFGFDTYSRGLRDALKHARIRRAIVQAADLLPSDSTIHSKATTVSSTLRRLARCYPRMSPKTDFEERLADAVRAADGSPPLAVSGLWRIIEGGIQDDEI